VRCAGQWRKTVAAKATSTLGLVCRHVKHADCMSKLCIRCCVVSVYKILRNYGVQLRYVRSANFVNDTKRTEQIQRRVTKLLSVYTVYDVERLNHLGITSRSSD